jgi:hypothetical protein
VERYSFEHVYDVVISWSEKFRGQRCHPVAPDDYSAQQESAEEEGYQYLLVISDVSKGCKGEGSFTPMPAMSGFIEIFLSHPLVEIME